MKRTLPLYLMFIFAIWGGISVFIGKTAVHDIDNLMRNKLLMIISAFAIILGLGSLIYHHVIKIKRRARFWQYSYVTMITLVVSTFLGLFGGVRGEGKLPTIFGGVLLSTYENQVYVLADKAEYKAFTANPAKYADLNKAIMPLPSSMTGTLNRYKESVLRKEIRLHQAKYRMMGQAVPDLVSPVSGKIVPFESDFSIHIQQLYEGILVPCGSTMFAMLAFYMCSAAFRAFRMRNLHAGVLLVSAFIVMLGQIPIITAFVPGVHELRQWILDIPNLASKRGIMIGVGLGSAATAFKILFGIERAWLGGGDE